jgi:hypothetical protein
MTTKTCAVTFFLRSGASIKIGTAKNFEKRFAGLQKAHKKPLKVLAVVPAEIAPEVELRARFADLVVPRRGFRADRALLRHIKDLKAQADLLAIEAASEAAEAEAPARQKPAKPVPPPMPETERAARDLTAKVPSLPKELHPIAYGAIEQLYNMAGYEPGPWVSDPRQTLPYQLQKSLARLGG